MLSVSGDSVGNTATMDITIIQLDPVWESPHATFEKVERLLKTEPPAADGLVILPEMFATGFSLNLAKTCAGPGLDVEGFLVRIAQEYRVTVLGGLVVPGDDELGRNEALVISPEGEVIGRYIKQRPFSGAGEDAVHERGFEGTTFSWAGMRVAPLICYDLRFPELFRAGAKAGAEMFAVIAAWPKKRIDHWIALLQARAIENQAYVVGVNRTGNEPTFQYCGRSIVVDPQGKIVADAGEKEGLLAVPIDAEWPRRWREEFPAYNDFQRWS